MQRLVCVVMIGLSTVAYADDAKPKQPPAKQDRKPKEQNIVIGGLKIGGQLRSPQLLYFLERANEELERASLTRRSFIPKLVETVDAEAL